MLIIGGVGSPPWKEIICRASEMLLFFCHVSRQCQQNEVYKEKIFVFFPLSRSLSLHSMGDNIRCNCLTATKSCALSASAPENVFSHYVISFGLWLLTIYDCFVIFSGNREKLIFSISPFPSHYRTWFVICKGKRVKVLSDGLTVWKLSSLSFLSFLSIRMPCKVMGYFLYYTLNNKGRRV